MKTIPRKDQCLAAIGERPAEVTDDSKWDEMDRNVIANLHLALADGVLSSIEEKKTAKDIWDHLAKLYEARSLHNKKKFKRKLYALCMTKSTSVTKHVNNLNTLFSQLISLDCKIEPHERVEILLQSLPDSYDQEENRRNNRQDMQTSSRQVEALMVIRERSMEPGSSGSHNHGKSKTKKKKNNFKCLKCGKPCHFKKDYRVQTPLILKEMSLALLMMVTLCVVKQQLQMKAERDLQICNDHEFKFIGIKSVMVMMHDGTVRTIRDMRHVKGLKKNLLSLGQFDDLGCKVEIQNKIMKIIKGVLVLMKGEKVAANLYQLKREIIEEAEASVASHSPSQRVAVSWHLKLRHMSKQGMKILVERKLILGLTKVSLPFCEYCVISKQHHLKFKASNSRSVYVLELVHSNSNDSFEVAQHEVNETNESQAPTTHTLNRERRRPGCHSDYVMKSNKATQEEIEALYKNKTWEHVPLPGGRKPIGNKWVYKIKKNSDDQVERYRARLVVKGYA
nr:hypothetical protein [Tanacetum cinerariifolium]